MGVAGATADNHFIVLAGIAGLLAGAFSMAAGEYISMQSQREVFERQIAVEREEMRVMPDVEQQELEQIYRAKGLPAADAARVAAHLMEDPKIALDTKVREELGLDPDELGSSWGAAISSFIAFSVGAVIPLLPFLLTTGTVAFVAALTMSFIALFLIGAGRQRAYRPQPDLQRHSPGSHWRGGGGRHVRRGHAHRCECRLIHTRPGYARKASNRRAGVTGRATATASMPTTTTRCWSLRPARSSST